MHPESEALSLSRKEIYLQQIVSPLISIHKSLGVINEKSNQDIFKLSEERSTGLTGFPPDSKRLFHSTGVISNLDDSELISFRYYQAKDGDPYEYNSKPNLAFVKGKFMGQEGKWIFDLDKIYIAFEISQSTEIITLISEQQFSSQTFADSPHEAMNECIRDLGEVINQFTVLIDKLPVLPKVIYKYFSGSALYTWLKRNNIKRNSLTS